LHHQDVTLPTENGKSLFGWFIPAIWSGSKGQSPCVVLLHGWGGNAETLLPLAQLLHEAGFALLFIDARCHGKSDEGNLELIRKAQMVVANLNPFRGAEPDSGTVFELGYGMALGKKHWGYVASGETLLERVSRLDGKAMIEGEPHPTDAQDLVIENYGLPLNLMLAMPIHLIEGDLAACIAAIRPRIVAASAATISPKEECLGV